MRSSWGLVVISGLVGLAVGCGGKPPVPKRGVIEGDLGAWKFRRFQGPLLDVEVWVDGNKGEAYTASYMTDAAEKRGRVTDKDIVNVFVTRYEKDEGIVRETVKLAKRLASEKGYRVDEGKVGKTRALSIIGDGEAWVMWPSKRSVVKVGGRGLQVVPETMIEKYADRFPSQLPGGALEGALPSATGEVKKTEKFEYDPTAPKPDMEKYDPKKVKIPQKDKQVDLDDNGKKVDGKFEPEPDKKKSEEPKKKSKKDDDEPKEKKKVKKADLEDETPKATAKKKITDEEPKKKAKKADADEEQPKKKAKKADADEEQPKKKAKKADAVDEEQPKKKAKKADADEEQPKKKAKKADADEEQPKKKAKKADAADDEEKSAKWKGKSKSADTDEDEEKPKKKAKKKSDD